MTENITELSGKDFDKLTAKGKWVIDFWAPWCGPCRMLAPEFEAAAKELKGKVNFGKVNIDNEQGLAERFDVMSIPNLVFLKDGNFADNSVGLVSRKDIMEKAKGI